MTDRLRETGEAAKKLHEEFPTNWTYHAPDHFEKLYLHFITILTLCQKYRDGIGEIWELHNDNMTDISQDTRSLCKKLLEE